MSALPSGMSSTPAETSGSQLPGPHPVLAPLGDPRVLPLDRPVTLAGSGPRCRLHLRSSTVSKVHAILIRDGTTVYIRDLASREGVKVDDEPVRECLLTGGERITIGRFQFVFEAVPSARMPRRAPAGSVQGIEIESRTFLIGRRNTADLVIDNDQVSSAHALLLEYNGKRYVRDLGSRTGVLLNGHRVQWEYLKSGDVLTIAGQEIVYAEAEPVRLEPKMRLSTPGSSLLIGPGGTIEQATFLSETLSEQLTGFTNDDSVAGAVEARLDDSTAQDLPAATHDDNAADVVPAEALDDTPAPWGGIAGAVALDDGTHTPDDDDPAPKPARTQPLQPGEMFSGHTLPLAPETPGVEALLPPHVPVDTPPTGAATPEPPTDLKPSPLPYDPLAAYATPQPPPPVSTHTNPTPADRVLDDFESLMAGLDVDAAATDATTTTPEARPVADERSFAPPPAGEAAEGITLELSFDDPPLPSPIPSTTAQADPSTPPPATALTEAGPVEPVEPRLGPVPQSLRPVGQAPSPADNTPPPAPPPPPTADAAPPGWGPSAVVVPPTAAPDSPLLAATRKATTSSTTPAPAFQRPADALSARPDDPEPLTAAVPRPPVPPEHRELGENFDRMLRGAAAMPEASDDVEPLGLRGARVLRTLVRWVVVGALVAAAAYAGWSLAAPVPQVAAKVRLPPGLTSPSVLAADTVRLRAIELLAQTDPSVPPGQLQNEAVLRAWAEAATLTSGTLSLTVVGDREEAARLRALLRAATEHATPAPLSPEQAALTGRDQVAAAEQALAAAEQRLLDARQRAADADLLPSLASELRNAEKRRDQIAARLDSLRSATPVTDADAQRTLDNAVASFQKQLDAARSAPTPDQRLATFIAIAQAVQEQGASLIDEILASRQEQAQRLQSLKRRLDERMRIRQQQAWDNDPELRRLTEAFEATRRRLNDARERNDLTAAQDLAGELDYYEGLITSRRALIGRDRGDERALAEVQSIIEEQAQATEADRKRLADSFESMRQTIVRAMPELASLPDTEFRLAADLEARLSELQTARANLAEAAAAAIRRHEDALRKLEDELADAEAALVEKGQALESARQSVPTADELRQLEHRVQHARQLLADAQTAAQRATLATAASEPEVRLVSAETPHRPYYALGAALLTLLLLSPLLRYRGTSLA